MSFTTAKYFTFAHLPPKLQNVSKPIGELAAKLQSLLPDGPEKCVGMRKLLEAKDCFVRAALDLPDTTAVTLLPHQQRVLDEKLELDDRLQKLTAFFSTSLFHSLPKAEQVRLKRQEVAMRGYSEILGERIAAF